MMRLLQLSGLALLCGAAAAQNGSNYHVLTNGADVTYLGVGAGGAQGAQGAQDGLGTWVAGEDLKGSHLTPLGDFGYLNVAFRESLCVLQPGPGGATALRFPALLFLELRGMNPHAPPVFTNPACTQPSFPLGASGFVPYGTAPGASASFVTALVPSAILPGGVAALVPNVGLLPSAIGGQVEVVGAASVPGLPIASTGLCWTVQFTWSPSAMALHDDIDGLWHWVRNSPDDNQYWQLSNNEQNLWQSQSVGSDAQLTGVSVFSANVDYALDLSTPQPVTVAALAPRAGTTPYSAWTANVANEYGVVLHPNGGFDVGRGSSAISVSGTAGVPNPVTGVGNQDPSLGTAVTTLGFATWDDGGDFDGSLRATWMSLDLLQVRGGHPATDPGVTQAGGTLRLPVVSAGLVQPLTVASLVGYGHVTSIGFADPYAAFFQLTIGGASWQVPLLQHPPACFGQAVNITYGTTGRLGALGAPGRLTFDPSIADLSGSRQLFLFD